MELLQVEVGLWVREALLYVYCMYVWKERGGEFI